MIPLSLSAGLFYPIATRNLLILIIGSRYLYLRGYLSNDGASSTVREIGAVTLNVSEIIIMLMLFWRAFDILYFHRVRGWSSYKRLF